jgi:intracellular septation protein A
MIPLFKAFRPLLVDFLSTFVFIALYAVTGSVRDAIILGIAMGIGQILFLVATRRSVSAMQWMSLFLVFTLGSASLLTADPRFVMTKPSIGEAAIGLVMLKRGWMLRYVPAFVVDHVPVRILVMWGYVWAGLLFVLAAANLALATLATPAEWAWFAGTVPIGAQLLLFAVQYVSLRTRARRGRRIAPAAE